MATDPRSAGVLGPRPVPADELLGRKAARYWVAKSGTTQNGGISVPPAH